MPTYTEMRQDILDRIAKLRKTSDDMKTLSEAPRKFVLDVMNGTITPTSDAPLTSAALAIQSADEIIIYCFNVEKKLRKLAADKGIIL